MAVRSYELVGPQSGYDEFWDYLYNQLLENKTLQLEATELGNELATKRGNTPRMFDIVVNEIYREASTINGRDTINGDFVQIRVDDATITLVAND